MPKRKPSEVDTPPPATLHITMALDTGGMVSIVDFSLGMPGLQ